jgi:pantoate--beta-alanine ligase
MKIILHKNKVEKFTHSENSLGFVPTMGAIHKGHTSLIKKSISENNKTLVSIFVNKPQFNNKSDYSNYPRNLKSDISKLKKLKVDFLFIPSHKTIYPNGVNKKIRINTLSKKLCGKFRPGHFNAVVDVINRFTKIINPKRIYLGEKDFQQLKIIEVFIKKNYKNIKVIGCKTIREKNGIAMSSRNFLLSKKEKIKASKIYKILKINRKKIIKKKIPIRKIKKKIINLGANKIDYIEIINVNKIIRPHKRIIKYKIFIAYYLGSVRLIDNI